MTDELMIWVSQELVMTVDGERPHGPVIVASPSKDDCLDFLRDWIDLPENMRKSVMTQRVAASALVDALVARVLP